MISSRIFCVYIMIALNHKHAISSSASSQTRLLTEAQTIELQVLTSLYHSSSGSTWTVSTSWLDEVSHCSWFGVTCDDDNHVSKIELSSNNLRGSVPLRALLRLPYLKVLKIDGNSVDSNIGEGVDIRLWEGMVFDDLTSSASVISSLQYIDLSHTDVLSGQISNLYSPSYIINPDQSSSPIAEKEVSYPYLNDLYLSGCDLRSAPSEKEWAKFGALERWVLDDNMMSGTVPSSLQMNNLRVFSANGNKLSGELDGFGILDKLRHLSLRGNQYHGSIPPGLRCDGTSSVGPKLLEILDLSNQGGNDGDTSVGLTGDLPSFSQCENLRRLDLSRNSIGGSFPADFLKLVDPLVFEEAMLNSNKIEGELPSSLSRFDADAIAVQDNRITELDEESLCDPHRSGAIAAFGCDAVLCPPGKYYPGTGRQEEAGEECRTCEGAKYWGAISCVDETFAIDSLPVSAPVQLPSSDEPAMAEEDQKTILMQLFESSGGQSWKHNNGWVRHDVISICDWWGVDCIIGTKSVERIDLQSNNLQGIVPTSIFQLPGLKELVLKDNSIFPTKANALDFFSEISKSSSLEILDLTSTGLSTVVGIENAPASLSELYLDSNPFGSSIPNEIFSLGHLKTLSMDNCNLSGSISNTIHQLGALMVLSASDNQLSGYLPPELSYLTSLSSIKLKNNRFSGTLPQTFNLLSALAYLDLSGQRQGGNQGLEGPLREFSEATKITRIDLSTNSFSGPVPGFFLASVDPDSFEFADLSDNMLVSSFPVGLGPIANKVYLQQNHISIIQEICDIAIKGSDLDSIGCDALLCAPGTYNSLGRSTDDHPCLRCADSDSVQYFGGVTCGGLDTTLISEEDAVKLIYSSCDGENWVSHTSWLSDAIPYCKWEGITCSTDGSITAISLRSNGLACAFPVKEILGALPALDSLALEGNDVSFDFTMIDGSPVLTALDITNTNVESLNGVEAMSKLVELYAGSNNLIGTLPKKILQLSYLERLDLSFNSFGSSLPVNLGFGLKRMKVLSLGHNDITGTIPTSLGQMTQLQSLQIQANQITGQVPQEVLKLAELEYIDLSDQSGFGLSGPLPIFSSHQLNTLDLSGNSFSGPIPDNFVSAVDTNSLKLDLSSNMLSGEVPSSLSRFPLSSLVLADNKITGISVELCGNDCALVLCAPTTFSESGRQPSPDVYCQHCPSAVYWGATSCAGTTPTNQPVSISEGAVSSGVSPSETEIDKVKLIYESCGGDDWTHKDNWMSSKSICNWYGIECNEEGSVESIILSGNNLKGVFPPNIFFLPNLETLALDSNNLQFSFSSIKYAARLTSFDLSETGLFKIDGIQEAPALSSLDISRNDFKIIPLEVFQISTLQQLKMGANDFQSSLPTSIGELKQLKFLSCSSCSLEGSIPISIGLLTNLVHLNLEDNHLSGSLPSEIEHLENLAFLDLSGQSLQGKLPSLKTLRELRRLDLSKNTFSGEVPDEFLSGVNPLFFDYLDLSENYLSGTVPSILSHFDTIYLQENQFTAIDSELCDKSRGGVFKQFGCDAILCPVSMYNVMGRQDSQANPCLFCPSSLYYGSTSCNSTDSEIPIEALELLPSDIVQEQKALSIFYHKCGGDYWTSNIHWMDSRLSHCHWKGIECHNGTKSVKSISLGSNNVLGTPPQEIFELLPNLNTLHLNSNPLNSFNFHQLETATRLTDLNLDAIGLTSLIGIESAPSLRRLSLRSNRLSGPFPQELFELKTLTSLILGHNNFTGPIPPRFEQLPYLETLIINDNELTGKLEGLTFPRTIKLLDISGNHLSGTVPSLFLQNVPTSVQVGVDLTDNQITAIDQHVCTMSNLNWGDVQKHGCNGLLCPIGYYSSTGRHSSVGECLHCPSATYLGTTECVDNHNGPALWAPLVLGLMIILGIVVVVTRRMHHAREMVQHEDEESLILEPDGSTLDAPGCLA